MSDCKGPQHQRGKLGNWLSSIEPVRFVVSLGVLGGLSLLGVAAFYVWHFRKISAKPETWGIFGDYFGGIGGTIIAALALLALAISAKLQSDQLRNDKEQRLAEMLLAEIDEHYRRALESIAPTGNDNLPNNGRLAWLSTARLLLSADQLSMKLPASYREILDSKKLYWRYMFHDVLAPLDAAPESYWAEGPLQSLGWKQGEREPISERSAKVVHDWIYSDWPDPMENQPRFSDADIDKLMKFRWRGLGELLRKIRDLKNKA